MRHRLGVFLFGMVVSIAAAFALSAQCVVDISTGFDAAAGVVLTEGDPDDSYTVDDGTGPVPALTGGAGQGFPVPTWVPNTDTSLWVSNSPDSNADPGTYTYEIRFELSADADPAGLSMIGSYAVDNGLTELLVNGTAVSVPAAAFTAMVEFPAGTAEGQLVEGENVIQFVTSNAGDAANPAGLRVDACVGVADAPEVEERAIDISTGFDDAGLTTIENGAADDEYVITGPEGSGIGPAPATLVNDNAFPIPPWIASSIQSKWIGPQADSNGPAGIFVYTTEVEIPDDIDATVAVIGGAFAADDVLMDVLVNGSSAGVTAPGFGALTPFPEGAGLGLFMNGANTVEFLVSNGGDGPTGLRVDGEIIATCPAPPPSEVTPSDLVLDTGFADADGALIENGLPDDNYEVIGPAGTDVCRGAAVVINDAAFPIGGGPWLATSERSKWIGVQADSNGPPGVYRFRTRVNVPDDLNAATLLLRGGWSTDNGGLDVLINGVSTGATTDGNFTTLHPFSLTAGLGLFQPGENTVEFVLENAPPGVNPVGLRVEAVVAGGGEPTQLVSDCDQDGVLSVGDVVCSVSLLFPGFNLLTRTAPPLPCADDAGNLFVLDFNGDETADLADLVGLATYLFEGGAPPALGTECVAVPGCDGTCN